MAKVVVTACIAKEVLVEQYRPLNKRNPRLQLQTLKTLNQLRISKSMGMMTTTRERVMTMATRIGTTNHFTRTVRGMM